MENARQQVAHWVEEASSVLGLVAQVRDDCGATKAALEALEAECAKLREERAALRAENHRLLSEGRKIAETITAELAKVNDALGQFRACVEASAAAPPARAVTAAAEAVGDSPVFAEPPMATLAVAPAVDLVAAPPPEELREPGRRRILLVDDDAAIRSMITEYLTLTPAYEVMSAGTGEDALTLLENDEPHVVLLDLMMPGMGGMEALRQIKALYPRLCVVMVTANEDLEVAREALALGAADYLTKPFDLEYLGALLDLYMTKPDTPPVAAPLLMGVPPRSPFARR